ncbi:MAG: hypothetical protein H7293_07255 [Candidatus Saccharibacteria bacterium]|nr:hypothetical protein [Rhodoferax sp.]
MAVEDVSRYFSDLSPCAGILLAMQDQFLDAGITSLFKRINYGEGLAIANSNHAKLSAIQFELNRSLASDTSLQGISNYANSLANYASALCKILEGLNTKANGKSYAIQEYKADLGRVDRTREMCGEAQSRVFR